MLQHFSTLVLFATFVHSQNNIVQLRARKIPGIVSDQAQSSIEVGVGGSVWMTCLTYYHLLGQTNCSLVNVNGNTGKCRWIDHRSYSLTADTQWDLYYIGKSFHPNIFMAMLVSKIRTNASPRRGGTGQGARRDERLLLTCRNLCRWVLKSIKFGKREL